MTGNVKEQTLKAYYDSSSNKDFGETTGVRDLNYLAPKPVSVDWAIEIMKEATPNGYNRFDPRHSINQVVQLFKGEPKIILARESSVAMFVIGEMKEGIRDTEIPSDEHHTFETGEEFIQNRLDRQERNRENEYGHDSIQQLTDEVKKAVRGNPVHRFWWD